MIGPEQLREALDHAIARVREFDGGPLADKFDAFGLAVDELAVLLEDRWRAHTLGCPTTEREHQLFVQAYAEGLLVGVQARSRREVVPL